MFGTVEKVVVEYQISRSKQENDWLRRLLVWITPEIKRCAIGSLLCRYYLLN